MCGKATDSRGQTAACTGAEATCSSCVDLWQRDLQLQAHPREVASFSHWHLGETHEEALARPARFATNSFACFAAKVRLDLCQQCPNSQRDRRSAAKQGVVLLDCAPAHLPRQVMAMARKCKLQLIYIPAQTTDYLQPLDLQGFSPFKQYLKGSTRSCAHIQSTV